MQTGELVKKQEDVESSLVSPASIGQTLEAVKRFEEFKTKVLKESDYVLIKAQQGPPKRYVKKSGWMLYALACQLSLEKRDERVEKAEDATITYHYTYRAIAPSGRFADADGSASSNERIFSHPVHDVRALAQTRACNRAVSNLVAGGEVSAEEIPDDDTPAQDAAKAEKATSVGRSRPVETQPGKSSKKDLPYPLGEGSMLFAVVKDFCDERVKQWRQGSYEFSRNAVGDITAVLFRNVPSSETFEAWDNMVSEIPSRGGE